MSTKTNSSSIEDILGDLDFEPDELKVRYLAERDKRLRSEGNDQYIQVEAEFPRYVDDPYVESYCYLPLLEELCYIPKHKYSFAPEIFEHSKRIARHFNLYDNACFQTCVTALKWDQDISRWIISTNRGDEMKAQYISMANGPLNQPKLPGIPGINKYKGHTFHTSRWDYGYTGGDNSGNLKGLKNKRVGIIGTGATAIQCVPALGESAEELYVFQRTPSSVDTRNNVETDPEWAKSLEPGWQRKRMENFNALVSGADQDEDLVSDGWTDITRRAGYDIVGVDEKSLSDHWQDGLRTFHGLQAHGFPNCFFMGFTQTAVTVNVPHALDEQARHIAYIISEVKARGKSVADASQNAEQAYVDEIHSFGELGKRFYQECTPGYYNGEGKQGNRNGFFTDMYSLGATAFFGKLDRWRKDGSLNGLDLT
jgi:cation diffusion facilitator CzcD-associated flavoprotein CzcO